VAYFGFIALLIAADVMLRTSHPVIGILLTVLGWACWIFGTKLAIAKSRSERHVNRIFFARAIAKNISHIDLREYE
jgi:hypothetical protein